MRWSLASMFVATAFVAGASLAAKYGIAGREPLCLLAVPILIGVAVGMLAGQVGPWIRYGVQADIVLMGLVLLDRLIRTGSAAASRQPEQFPLVIHGLTVRPAR
jgi:hypothetical protein